MAVSQSALRKALKGRQALVRPQGMEIVVFIAHSEALRIHEQSGGEIFVRVREEDHVVVVEYNGEYQYGDSEIVYEA